MRLLLMSNSRQPGLGDLEHARDIIADFLPADVRRIAFVPHAAVTQAYDDYARDITPVLEDLGRELVSIHAVPEADQAGLIRAADVVIVGGGNTWKLLGELRRAGLLPIIRERVNEGTPYIGWSAGANIACPTIATTNDMPIADPGGFDALGLVPFQVNAHYLHGNPPGFDGETREARIREYLELHREATVVGLREGTMLEVVDGAIRLIGDRPCRVFRYGREPLELDPSADVSFLLGAAAPPQTGLEGTAWRLVSYRGPDGAMTDVPAEVRATATFQGGRAVGTGGCNRYTGAVEVDGDGLAVSGVASTMRACPPPASTVEAAFLAALGEAERWAIGDGGSLLLRAADGSVALRFEPERTPNLVGTPWAAIAVNNGRGGVASLVAGTTITATFGADGRVSGSGGCNGYSGPYSVEGATLSIGPAAATARACLGPGVMEQEAAFFAALGRVARFTIDGDRLELRSEEGALQVDLRPAEPPA